MREILPLKLTELAETCPYPLYAVGGSVRDYLAGLKSDRADIDICAPASAADFAARAKELGFSVHAAYKNTGALKLTAEGQDYEFTCFRSDEYVRGEHVPVNTYFTEDINLDARRRDFKCNAVYYDIAADKIVDPLNGVEDIKNKRLTAVADSGKVFGEDGLRLMRLARIAGQTGFEPSADCLNAARENSALIDDISPERIWGELKLLLSADLKYGVKYGHYAGLKILSDTSVLDRIIPELSAGRGMLQRADFHRYDVLEHSLRCAMYAPPEIRLAALLHDVGKPERFNASGRFAGHEKSGAELVLKIAERLRVPKKLAVETSVLVAVHMYDFRGDARKNKVKKFIISNYSLFDKILMLKQADFSACRDDESEAPSVSKFKAVYAEMLDEGAPFTLSQLKIKGDTLIKAGFPPEITGDVLLKILSDCAIGAVKNDESTLLDYALKVYLPKNLRCK